MERIGAISGGREPQSGLGQVFNFKLGSFTSYQHKCMAYRPCPFSRSLSMAYANSPKGSAPTHVPTCFVEAYVTLDGMFGVSIKISQFTLYKILLPQLHFTFNPPLLKHAFNYCLI
jgi:hypothetical protein